MTKQDIDNILKILEKLIALLEEMENKRKAIPTWTICERRSENFSGFRFSIQLFFFCRHFNAACCLLVYVAPYVAFEIQTRPRDHSHLSDG